ncbi:RNA polymerase sigma-70 factor [Pedobacter sp. KBW06]|uniref:RNA polymerase sigma factor n=1 Tax=Pedobacter sp. KBW06 TaxID=2153359 RepID=UPI000F599F51|nr:RNA polymerase sigma-70 factor [Pedobacter sp. KBW06]RQO75106.1 RNA polymerase sigma-70 factor [Pedobacter sp. KBW06]
MKAYHTFSDQELTLMLRHGEKGALTEIYKRYQPLLYSHAYRRLPDQEEIRDIIQELFITLWDNRSSFQLNGSLASYLYTSVRNRILNLYRSQKVRDSYSLSLKNFMEQGSNITEEALREKELIQLVEQEVAALPPQMRLIFEMSRNLDMSHNEIALELDLSPHTVRTQVRNALRILREKLGVNIFLIFF